MVWSVYMNWHGTKVPVGTGYQTKQEAADAVARHCARAYEATKAFTVVEEPSGDPNEGKQDAVADADWEDDESSPQS